MADPRDEERGDYGAGDRTVSELANPRSPATQKSSARDGQDGGAA